MSSTVQVEWLDSGPSKGKIDTINRRFVIDKGDLTKGQHVSVQMSTKKTSKAKVWKAKVVKTSLDDRPREPTRKRNRESTACTH